jgi:outer membrane protein assembly factor BamB
MKTQKKFMKKIQKKLQRILISKKVDILRRIYKISFFSILFLMGLNQAFSQENLETVMPLKWKTYIGKTTYRTNMQFYNGKIYIGSNGYDRNRQNDSLDGVFEINAKNGNISHQFSSELLGDNDVNGVAIGNGKIYFGGDNYHFYCYDLASKKEVWKFNTTYDVESCPALADLNRDGKLDVIFNVENSGVYALNGENGSVIWKNDTLNSKHGNSSPTLWDINNDGTLDAIMSIRGNSNSDQVAGFKMEHYGDYYLALNGKNGQPLWIVESGAGIHASGHLVKDYKGTTYFMCSDSYGELSYINQKGIKSKQIGLGYAVFSSAIEVNKKIIACKNEGWAENNIYVISVDKSDYEKAEFYEELLKEDSKVDYYKINGIISASPVVADFFGTGKAQILAISEAGQMIFISNDGTSKIYNFQSGAEATPFVADIDGDKKLELLIASLDGYLYCYGTISTATPVVGDFRQGLSNAGVLK